MIADTRLLQLMTGIIVEYRFKLQSERNERMALELKGLKGKAIKAAANIDRLNAAYDKFNEMAPAHAADVEGLAPQLEGLVEDLSFAAQTLGNSVNGSGEPVEQPKPAPVSEHTEPPPANPASPPDDWPGKHQGQPHIENGASH